MQAPYNPNTPPMPSSKTGFGAMEISNKRVYWDSNIKFFRLEPQGWQRYRFVGPVTKVEYHWLELPRKGTNGAIKRIPLICPDFDVRNQKKNFSDLQCPICKIGREELKSHEKFKKILPTPLYLAHLIVRSAQENPSAAITVNPIKLSMSLARKLYELGELNQVNYQGQLVKADLADPYWGRDVFINYDDKKAPTDRYMVNLDSAPRPLSAEEFAALNTVNDFRNIVEVSTPKEIEDALVSCNYMDRSGNLILSAVAAQAIPPSAAPVSGISMDIAQQVVPQTSAGLSFSSASPASSTSVNQPNSMVPPPPKTPVFIDSVELPTVQSGFVNSPAIQPHLGGQTTQTHIAVNRPVEMTVHQGGPVDVMVQQGNAALARQEYAVPSFEKRFQVVGAPKPLTGAELEQFIKQYAEANASLCTPLQPATNGELLGFHVPKCFAKYRGDAVCIRCPIRKQCIA